MIVQGETIYSLARSYGLSASALQEANGITDPSLLRVGQRLLIPSIHRVAKGETLFGIARAASTTVKELRRLNGLSDTAVIHVGDILILPSGAAPSSTGSPGTGASAGASASSASTSHPNSGSPTLSKSGDSQAQSVAKTDPSPGPAAPKPLSNATDLPEARPPTPASSAILASADLPCSGAVRYLDGKVFGIAIRSSEGSAVHSVTNGLVVSAGPYRGFGSVVFVQTSSGLIYVYGGNRRIDVRVGDRVVKGQTLGRVGNDAFSGATDAYFFVFKGSKALDPATAPRN
ncbi:MAG TPA: LysM peptidoglycan-binding domain-containing protein [Rectinemataceae bacterium]|nr:LysM peptidoglycan-binding domain-containing protein [Rectinemataceae bacterium]